MISFTLRVSTGPIQAGILRECAIHLGKVMPQVAYEVEGKAQNLVIEALENSPTWQSISSGELRDLLLIPSPTACLADIESVILKSIKVVQNPVRISGSQLTGSFEINILNDNYGDLMSLSTSYYMTANSRPITWLSWLLFSGTDPVLESAKLVNTPRGVLLVNSTTDLYIPSAHAGIQKDNFLTRALNPLEKTLGQIMEEAFSRRT